MVWPRCCSNLVYRRTVKPYRYPKSGSKHPYSFQFFESQVVCSDQPFVSLVVAHGTGRYTAGSFPRCPFSRRRFYIRIGVNGTTSLLHQGINWYDLLGAYLMVNGPHCMLSRADCRCLGLREGFEGRYTPPLFVTSY